MSARTAVAPKTAAKAQRELEDLQLVLKARNGSSVALDSLIRRYTPFVRLKASAYFLVGGGNDDLIQEGLIGLYKAVRDFRPDKETSFRSFAELCVTRQIITAIKTATRFKHSPLNTYGSFSHTLAGQTPTATACHTPAGRTSTTRRARISSEEPGACRPFARRCRRSVGRAAPYLEGCSYETMAEDSAATRRRSTTRSSGSSGRS
jgi:RNA polymerase sporulation-specific sigma factor